MKKIILALGVVALLASCQKSILYSGQLYDNGVVSFQTSSSGEIAAFLEALHTTYLHVFVEHDGLAPTCHPPLIAGVSRGLEPVTIV